MPAFSQTRREQTSIGDRQDTTPPLGLVHPPPQLSRPFARDPFPLAHPPVHPPQLHLNAHRLPHDATRLAVVEPIPPQPSSLSPPAASPSSSPAFSTTPPPDQSSATPTPSVSSQMSDPPDAVFLDGDQFNRLKSVLLVPVKVSGNSTLPPFCVEPLRLCSTVKQAILEARIGIREIRLEGSTAAYCATDQDPAFPVVFRDFDFVFYLEGESRADLVEMRSIVLACIARFLPEPLQTIDEYSLTAEYVAKMFITPAPLNPSDDAWALVTLRNYPHYPAIDLKFVQRIHRPFQFSVDSLQLVLPELNPMLAPPTASSPIPRVLLRTSYWNSDARHVLRHVREKIIHVENPEEMSHVFGGGLLKYCSLLTRGFCLANPAGQQKLESVMTNRFQKDYPLSELCRRGTPMLLQRVADYVSMHIVSHEECSAFLINLIGIFASFRDSPKAVARAIYSSVVERRRPFDINTKPFDALDHYWETHLTTGKSQYALPKQPVVLKVLCNPSIRAASSAYVPRSTAAQAVDPTQPVFIPPSMSSSASTSIAISPPSFDILPVQPNTPPNRLEHPLLPSIRVCPVPTDVIPPHTFTAFAAFSGHLLPGPDSSDDTSSESSCASSLSFTSGPLAPGSFDAMHAASAAAFPALYSSTVFSPSGLRLQPARSAGSLDSTAQPRIS
eukprot:m.178983 g.178983  ORF g.178983 m.178983 type:complete len:671 (+) comp53410_c0_seq1:278-2290(+)